MKKEEDIIKVEVVKEINNNQVTEKDNQICYICREKPVDPINPAGCIHIFCRPHLKVN
jgi:hypothetical protein